MKSSSDNASSKEVKTGFTYLGMSSGVRKVIPKYSAGPWTYSASITVSSFVVILEVKTDDYIACLDVITP